MTTIFMLCLLSQNPLAPPDSVLIAAPAVVPSVPAATSPAAPAPELWDLKDSRGQIWRHTDKECLKWWVAGRNSVLGQSQTEVQSVQTQTPVQTQQTQYQPQTQIQVQPQVQTQPQIQYTYNQPQYGYQQQVQPRACQGASLQSLRSFYYAPQR